MSGELQDRLVGYIESAIDVRFQFQAPEFGAEATELHQSLVQVQEVLTELERLLSNAIRAKALLDRRVAQNRMVWQEAWDRSISTPNKRLALSEYATGKEKAAEANLATLNEARTLRTAEEMQSFAAEAVDVIRLHYYGLDKVRQDIRKRLDMSHADYYS